MRGEKEKKRNLMKHRLASLGPRGVYGLLFLFFFSFLFVEE